MEKTIISPMTSFQMMPRVIGALKGLNVPLFHTAQNLPHPEVLISSKWLSLVRLIEDFLNTYERYDLLVKENAPRPPYTLPNGSSPSLEEVMQAYKAIIYEADELIEKLHSKLKICLLPQDKTHQWHNSLKRWRDHPSAVCNKLKHNHNLLTPVAGYYQFGTVRGYGICHYVNDKIIPNQDIHPQRFPFSFGTDLRRILAHIYLCAESATAQIKRIFPDSEASFHVAPPRHEDEIFLRKVSSFMPLNFHHYTHATDIPIFKYQNDGCLIISDKGGSIIPTGTGMVSTRFSGDGRTKTFSCF